MSIEIVPPEIQRGGDVAPLKFDPKSVAPFVDKSVSEATRRAYTLAVADFFGFAGGKHPAQVVPADVQRWRDWLRGQKKRPATVSFKLSVIRSFFEYLKAAGVVPFNPASTKLVSPPELPTEPAGRALTSKEVRYLLLGPDREKPKGARDYALMLVMLRLSLRVSEVCSLRASSVKWSHGRWILRCKVKGGREDAFLFQPHVNYRTLEFRKGISTRMVQKIVERWADYSRVGDLSPHDLRRTAITKALDSGLTYRQVQMMSKHKDPKTVMRYDYSRENLDQNAVNFLGYDDE